MKLLLSLTLITSFAAFAAPKFEAVPLKRVEVVSCANGTETLTIQLLGEVATFVEYKKNATTIYSSSSFAAPMLIPIGAGMFEANGIGSEADKRIIFGYDFLNLKATLDGVFAFDNCMLTHQTEISVD